jgi:hypothetical protein
MPAVPRRSGRDRTGVRVSGQGAVAERLHDLHAFKASLAGSDIVQRTTFQGVASYTRLIFDLAARVGHRAGHWQPFRNYRKQEYLAKRIEHA